MNFTEFFVLNIQNIISFSLLKSNTAPMDVNALHHECQKVTSVNLVTVYRSLQQFHEKGLVQEFLGKNSVAQYEYISEKFHAHPHFECKECGMVSCLGGLSLQDTLYFSNMVSKHKVKNISITLNGVCEKCQK